MKIYCQLLAIASAMCTLSSAIAEDSTYSWGPAPTVDESTYLVGSSGEGQSSAFDGGALVVLIAVDADFSQNIDAHGNDASAIFQNSVLIGSTEVGTGASAGYFSGYDTIDTAGLVGDLAYMWVLPGVTSYDELTVSGLSEYALLRDSSWGVITDGAGGVNPEPINYKTTSLDTIVVGNVVYNYGDYNDTLYTTAAVPEPAFYAAGLGVIALLIVQLRRRRAK